jgi:hypothetical protein
MDSKSTFLYAVSNKQNMETLLLIPPETTLDRFGMYTWENLSTGNGGYVSR